MAGNARRRGTQPLDDGPSTDDIDRFSGVTTSCPSCGTEIRDDVDLCWKCGHAISDPTDQRSPVWIVVAIALVLGAMLFWVTRF